jgi:cation:H+ antiporter
VGWLGGILLLAGIAGILAGAAVAVRGIKGSVSETGLGGFAFGLTAIAVGASLRGTVAGVMAARRGDGNQVLGGVVGASLLNLVLGVGLAAVARPFGVPNWVVMQLLPVLALSTLLLVPALLTGLRVRRWDGVVMLAAYAAFVTWVVWRALQPPPPGV